MALIEVDQVWKLFRDGAEEVSALENVSLVVSAGDLVALSGPSGSGKTTLLNLIGCLDRPTRGSVRVENEEVSSLAQRHLTTIRRAKVGFIFQDFNLLPSLSCYENVEYALRLQGLPAAERRRRVLEVAARFGIEMLLNRRPSQVSRGQQQRVSVARAVVHRPSVVLGDEFTANLDQGTAAALMDFLEELNREEGTTFVFASHDPLIVGRAKRIVRLRDGRLQGSEEVSRPIRPAYELPCRG
jgi:putative ABC transport system ATP-binding protein